MSPDLQAKCREFCQEAAEHTVDGGPMKALPISLDFLDGTIAAVVKGLTAANVALDKVIEWVPEIAMSLVMTAKSVQEVIADILSRIQSAPA